MIREGGGPIDGALQFELVRALTVADRANNAVLQERNGRWGVQGDPTEGALIVAARGRARGCRRSALASPASAKCRFLRAQADEHRAQRH